MRMIETIGSYQRRRVSKMRAPPVKRSTMRALAQSCRPPISRKWWRLIGTDNWPPARSGGVHHVEIGEGLCR
jgi:hypothetical protein